MGGPMECFTGTTPGQHWAQHGRNGLFKQQQLASASTQKLSPVYTAYTKPDLAWNGLPEKYQGNPVFEDMDHTDDHYTKDNKDPFGPKGQYGMWMNIQGDTINSFGCGPKGPMECFTGTTPGQHWAQNGRNGLFKQQQLASASTQKLSPVYTANTKPDLAWNGLPEKYQGNPVFEDMDHTDGHYTKDNKDP